MSALNVLTAKWPLAKYLGFPAVNHSLLFRLASRSPAHAHLEYLHPKPPTRYMELGDMAHAAILEPSRLDHDFIAIEHWIRDTEAGLQAFAEFVDVRKVAKHGRAGDVTDLDRQTREGKRFWAAVEAATHGQTPISIENHARLSGILAAVQSHTAASALLYGPDGTNEVTGAWEHAGVACKVRADRLTNVWGYAFDVEVKTVGDASAFERSAATYGYHLQAAMRLAGWEALGTMRGTSYPRRIVHVVVETDPPHGVRVVEFDDAALAAGRAMFERAVKTWGECLASDVWPAYADGAPEPISLPRWALASPTSSDDL